MIGLHSCERSWRPQKSALRCNSSPVTMENVCLRGSSIVSKCSSSSMVVSFCISSILLLGSWLSGLTRVVIPSLKASLGLSHLRSSFQNRYITKSSLIGCEIQMSHVFVKNDQLTAQCIIPRSKRRRTRHECECILTSPWISSPSPCFFRFISIISRCYFCQASTRCVPTVT